MVGHKSRQRIVVLRSQVASSQDAGVTTASRGNDSEPPENETVIVFLHKALSQLVEAIRKKHKIFNRDGILIGSAERRDAEYVATCAKFFIDPLKLLRAATLDEITVHRGTKSYSYKDFREWLEDGLATWEEEYADHWPCTAKQILTALNDFENIMSQPSHFEKEGAQKEDASGNGLSCRTSKDSSRIIGSHHMKKVLGHGSRTSDVEIECQLDREGWGTTFSMTITSCYDYGTKRIIHTLTSSSEATSVSRNRMALVIPRKNLEALEHQNLPQGSISHVLGALSYSREMHSSLNMKAGSDTGVEDVNKKNPFADNAGSIKDSPEVSVPGIGPSGIEYDCWEQEEDNDSLIGGSYGDHTQAVPASVF